MNKSKENLDFSNSKILITGLSLLILLVFLASFAYFFKNHLTKNWTSPADHPTDSPRQQLEFESGELAKETKAKQNHELQSYGWSDDKHQFAKVPLSRAMEIYLQNEKIREQVSK